MGPTSPFRPREPLNPKLRLELARFPFDGVVPLVIMAATFAAIGGIVVHLSRDPLLQGTYILAVTAACIRIGVTLRYRSRTTRRETDERTIVPWERAFAGGSFTFAALLGLFAARTVSLDTPLGHELLLALLFGYGSGVVARLSVRPWIALPSLALANAPPIVAFAWTGDAHNIIIAVVLAAFAIGSTETTAFIHRAVLAQVRMNHDLGVLAGRDPLTGLANRLVLEERLRTALAGLEPVALHYLDLDRFKPVNDTFGHETGDTLLRAVGGRIEGLLRAGDLVARIGGDEFVVLQMGSTSSGEAEFLARRILKAVHAPFAIAGHDIRIGGSVGVALSPEHGTDPRVLMAAADAALYRAKSRGRGNAVLASAEEPALAS